MLYREDDKWFRFLHTGSGSVSTSFATVKAALVGKIPLDVSKQATRKTHVVFVIRADLMQGVEMLLCSIEDIWLDSILW